MLRKKNKYEEIPGEPHSQLLHIDQDQLYITGYRNSNLKKWFFYIMNLPLCGAAILLLQWYPQYTYLKWKKSSLNCADSVLVRDSNDTYSLHPVCTIKISENETFSVLISGLNLENHLKYFIYKELRYVWLVDKMQFFELRDWCEGQKVKEFLDKSSGYSAEEQNLLLKIYGHNEIRVVVDSLWKILLNEVSRPFYLFQVFAIILWVINDYLCYAVCVILVSGWSLFITVFSTKNQKQSIKNLVKKSTANLVSVRRRNGELEKINPSHLVPGDIIVIPQNGCLMPCDALLLCGNCIVNESTLTGESSPVIKTPSTNPEEIFNPIILKNHVLFSGTSVLQTRYYGEGMVTALTISTGFSTIKGELVRCLLHPKPLGFKFYEDSVTFVFCLFIAASCGISYLVYISLMRKVLVKTLVLDSLDLITIVVPPSLPAALATGIAYSKSRLSSKGIFCICPPKINLFGKLKLMCFDKTGTLTEEGLNLCGILPCRNKKFEMMMESPTSLDPKHPLVVAFATCHSLTKINGKIAGDPLDLSMFNSLNWEFIQPGNDECRFDILCPTIVRPKYHHKVIKFGGTKLSTPSHNSGDRFCDIYFVKGKSSESDDTVQFENSGQNFGLPYEIGIVREFPFTSSSRCMSVITRELGSNHMNLYCKGAPEKIYELCKPDSIPDNFTRQLQTHAAMGFRVLGLAYREFNNKFSWRKSQRTERQEVEKELIFLGLILLQNNLKQVSTAVINELREANIRCVMVTGDNLLTALSVSRESLMILPGDPVFEVKVNLLGEPKLWLQPLETTSRGKEPRFFRNCQSLTETETRLPFCHYILDGKTWEQLRTHFNDCIPNIIVRGTVFARMLPEQKTQLIQAFQDLDYIVGMCGDGANDFGAMKAAHVGVSLSETENSVAAPFTSKIADVSCIITLVQEGRCALVSTFIIFKYMAMYGLIQFISVIIAYSKGVSFSNIQFLYVDFIVTSLLAIVIGRTGPSKILVKTRPYTRLISFCNLLPLVLQVILLFCIQLLALEFLYQQKWFVPVMPSSEPVTECWENTVIYCISLFQFLILALVYSKATPYRQPFYKDVFFMAVLISLSLFSAVLCVYPFRQLAEFFELLPVEEDNLLNSVFRLELLLFPLLNLVLSFIIEISIADRKWVKKIIHFIRAKKGAKNRYKQILLNSESRLG